MSSSPTPGVPGDAALGDPGHHGGRGAQRAGDGVEGVVDALDDLAEVALVARGVGPHREPALGAGLGQQPRVGGQRLRVRHPAGAGHARHQHAVLHAESQLGVVVELQPEEQEPQRKTQAPMEPVQSVAAQRRLDAGQAADEDQLKQDAGAHQ